MNKLILLLVIVATHPFCGMKPSWGPGWHRPPEKGTKEYKEMRKEVKRTIKSVNDREKVKRKGNLHGK